MDQREQQKLDMDRLGQILFDFRDDEKSLPGDAWHVDTLELDKDDLRAVWVRYRRMDDEWARDVDPPGLSEIFATGEDDDPDEGL